MRKESEADRVSLLRGNVKDNVQFDSLQMNEQKNETTSKSTSSLKSREVITKGYSWLCIKDTLLIIFFIGVVLVGPIIIAYSDRKYNGSWLWTIIVCSAFGVSIIVCLVCLVVYYCKKKNQRL